MKNNTAIVREVNCLKFNLGLQIWLTLNIHNIRNNSISFDFYLQHIGSLTWEYHVGVSEVFIQNSNLKLFNSERGSSGYWSC